MRFLLAASLLVLTAGCTVPPDAVTAPQEVEAATGQAASANEAVARSNAAAATRAAAIYVALNEGSAAGLADELRSSEAALVAGAADVTDKYISFEISPGECLYQPLPSGSAYESGC